MRENVRGFTIVELLIVIVVIAVLAAISLLTYNGIQQRAYNVSVIDAASKSVRMITAYIGSNESYPHTGGDACITTEVGCSDATTASVINSTFNTNMAKIGTLPIRVPKSGANAYGVRYNYRSARTYDGVSTPAVIQYYLLGSNQQCGIPRVVGNDWSTATPSTTGYFQSITTSDGMAKTECIISIQGPPHS